MKRAVLYIALVAGIGLVVAACDTGFMGSAHENQPPSTQLAVRDTSLVDNLTDEERLTSTVSVSWTGTDPDGYVAAYELRYFDTGEQLLPEDDWVRTTRTDTLILLPIPRGERAANVTFEVRAVDNEGLSDPNPARTVFPIENSPPAIRLGGFDLPPDTTFSVFSFSWVASDPEGVENLARIEVSFNDTTEFVAVDPDVEFATFVADIDRNDASQTVTSARLFTGRSFQSSGISVPGLRLDEDNTLHVRAVDQTDTTSVRAEFTWHVKKPSGQVLFVNDYRKASWPVVQNYHLALLREHLPAGEEVDIWNVSMPFTTGSSGNLVQADAMPANSIPTLRHMLATWDYIYWVSSSATNSIRGNNLPFAAPAMDLFFEQGGKLMVHTPMIEPDDPADNLGNPAILLLPVSEVITPPDTVRRLQLPTGAGLHPVQDLPGVAEELPPLETQRFFISELPYEATGNNIIPLYEADYEYRTQSGDLGDWPSPRTVASISSDRRVALFALPLVNEQTGDPVLYGTDGDPQAARRAVKLILQSLEFPE